MSEAFRPQTRYISLGESHKVNKMAEFDIEAIMAKMKNKQQNSTIRGRTKTVTFAAGTKPPPQTAPKKPTVVHIEQKVMQSNSRGHKDGVYVLVDPSTGNAWLVSNLSVCEGIKHYVQIQANDDLDQIGRYFVTKSDRCLACGQGFQNFSQVSCRHYQECNNIQKIRMLVRNYFKNK
jgi:hypothetical protein